MKQKKRNQRTSPVPENTLPFSLTPLMRFYLPICDADPFAAYLLAYFYERTVISHHESKEKQAAEEAEQEARLSHLSEEARERELERINDEAYEAHLDRLLNEYNGESFLNDEDDAHEGDGIFVVNFTKAIKAMDRNYFSKVAFTQEQCRQRLQDASALLESKGFLERISIYGELIFCAIEQAVQACYPQLYEQQETSDEATRRREATKVQYHVNIAKRYGLVATLTLAQWLETLDHFYWKCAYCLTGTYEVLEHIQPVIMGGGTYLENCVPACVSCNTTKRDTPPEFLPPVFDEALARIRHSFQTRKGKEG